MPPRRSATPSRQGSATRRDPTAREVAHAVLWRVERDGAWAERALDAAFARAGAGLAPRDRALVTDLVYGTLRHQAWLDFLLGCFANKPLSKLPIAALLALRLSAFQIVASRIPDHAAVDEGVSLVRRRHPRLAGVANAVLRQLAAGAGAGELPEPGARLPDPIAALAVRWSLPEWLARRVAALVGLDEARAWAEANEAPPPLCLRVNRRRSERVRLALELKDAGLEVLLPEGFPDGLVITGGAGSVEALPGYAAGHFVVQDLSAQLIARMASPRPGGVILDACAAPGGKSTHLAELMEDEGRVLALDVHPGKTRLIAANAARLGLASVVPAIGDALDQEALGRLVGDDGVDGVLLDAPCSGSGTLQRHPELRTRLPAEDLAPLCARQDGLLASVAEVVRPGGFLLYAVCSILPDEGEERVASFLATHPAFARERPADPALAPFLTATGELRTWPHRHGADGFFAARLVRG